MQLSQLDQTGIYLTDPAQAAKAVWGFIMWRNDGRKTVDLADTWNKNDGYYVFFPAANRGAGWAAFVSTLQDQMDNGTNRRFGFFDASGGGIGFLSVSGTADSQALTIGHDFAFGSTMTLSIQPSQTQVAATFDNATSTFKISNIQASGTQNLKWRTNAPGQGTRDIIPLGDLEIPVAGPTPGTLKTTLALSLDDQAAFETGPMYFGPALSPAQSNGALTALRYPTFLAGQTGSTVAMTSYVDPALPMTGTRSYFQLEDAQLKTSFVTSDGRQILLAPLPGSKDPDGLSSRLVFSVRPITQISDTSAFYLTPAGSFGMTQSGSTETGALLCGYSATETFAFQNSDVLRFVPGNAAYLDNVAAGDDTPARYLSTAARTSWVSLSSATRQNSYFSQPQTSPIYEDDGQTGDPQSLAYKLKFKPITAWPAEGTEPATAVASPPVPMVPYGGLDAPGAMVEAYNTLEAKGINPERRKVLSAANPHGSFAPLVVRNAADISETLTYSMTPAGLVGGFDQNNQWMNTRFAISGAQNNRLLQFEDMGDALRAAMYQNQIFVVIDRNIADAQPLFTFGDTDATVELADWFFDLQLQGQSPDGVPPIVLLKFFRDRSIKDLVSDRSLWTDSTVFSSAPDERQTQILEIIETAEKAVAKEGDSSIYATFVKAVTDPAFTGIIALNAALKLDELPSVIKALLGGMTKADGSSNIGAFRSHHVGVAISDTGNVPGVSLDSSSIFALVDYEDDSLTDGGGGAALPAVADASLDYYGFKVIYVRALFTNNALSSFAAEVDLMVNNLFSVGVDLGGGAGPGDDKNIIKISGSYSEHDGAQTYSFVAKKTYEFAFQGTSLENPYLQKITFDKVQFSATEEESGTGTTSTIKSRFAIWGSMEFKELEFLDMFSFKKLAFADLGIEMSYLLDAPGGGKEPSTSDLAMKFSPGNLRFDFGGTEQRTGDKSLLALLPFKLKSFLYSEKGQSITKLDYFGVNLSELTGNPKDATDPNLDFTYALILDLDLGSLGALVGDLSAFKFGVILGWQSPEQGGGLVFGIQMPEADGKLEINIEGVLKISIEEFVLKYNSDDADKLLVVSLHNSYMELLGTRVPPGNLFFDLALFAPTKGENKIGWIAALNAKDPPKEGGAVGMSMEGPLQAVQDAARKMAKDDPDVIRALAREIQAGESALPEARQANEQGGKDGDKDGDSSLLKLDYFGIGQRVGPDKKLDNFDDFLAFMRGDFWSAVKDGKYGDVYHADGGWIVVAHLELLELIELGFVFYDSTPFYSLKIAITKGSVKGLSFEITYTKVSDDVGLFFINFTLPDYLRTFQAGAASLTLPALKVSIYTNGDFKIDLGFPANDDWTVCFRVEAFAGPIPITGSGGFYIAKLSSATDKTFTATNYDTILAGGFGARLGVGKNFVAGPLKAGVSLTFFGIIEGAVGYYAYDSGSDDVVEWLCQPRALSLKGQFGVIGEIYGTLDFAIIKASVNVRIQASVGMQLLLEQNIGGDILLYIEASVSVSVSLKIGFGFFSISISFSFRASFRFEWKLMDNRSTQAVEKMAFLAELSGGAADVWNPDFPLQAGLNGALSTWMTPEFTTLWTDTSAVGTPWFVVSLTMEYLNDPASATLADFKPFETLAAQMTAWALNAALQLPSWDAEITQAQIDTLNQNPDLLVGGLDYPVLLEGLGKMVTLAVVSLPPDDGTLAAGDKETKYATIFPMPPFMGLRTAGRSTELDYTFASKSNVSQDWVANDLQAYFDQLYTNITGGGMDDTRGGSAATVPLTQAMFLDWFHAVTRSTVNALLTQMQNDDTATGKLSDIFLATVKSGEIRNVAGQMSQFFRSGLRLPQTAGMEIPAGSLEATNALYALIWQEFPVGPAEDYTVTLSGDSSQPWTTVDASWAIKAADVAPYKIAGSAISVPGAPEVVPFLQSGAQAFALANPITWTPNGATPTTLRPLPAAMTQALKTSAPLQIKVQSRATDKSYDPVTTDVPTTDITWALAVEMIVRRVPMGGKAFVPNTYALGAADLSVQNAMRDLLDAMGGNGSLVKGISLLYQTSADTPGVVSSQKPKQLFVLRTNTTTQSVPPPSLTADLLGGAPQTAVGAGTDDPFGFLQILEQSSVTNQTGYFLTFEDENGDALPDDLFGNQSFAPVTFLFELAQGPANGQYALPRYVTAAVLANTDDSQLYYAETTQSADEVPYVSTAAGALGLKLSRTEPVGDTVTDQLSNLYSLLAYQVPGSTGYTASNLSVPSGPQKAAETDSTQDWRLFVPGYKLASANDGVAEPNRYASIGDSLSVQTLVVDAFGNAFGAPQTAIADQANLYFDDLVPMGNWTGVRSIFDFHAWDNATDSTVCEAMDNGTMAAVAGGKPQAGKLSVYLCPSSEALPAPNSDSAAATIALYQTIIDQLETKGPGGAATTELFVTTNLDPTKSDIPLSTAQSAAVLDMLRGIVRYLQGGGDALPQISLTVSIPGSPADLGLVFEIQVDFGTRRTGFVAPEVTAADYQNAIRVTTNVPAPTGGEILKQLALDFSQAFPDFSLATGPGDASAVTVGQASDLGAALNAGPAAGQAKGLWAVAKSVTDLSVSHTVRHYLAPKPLDTALRSGTVALPYDMPGLTSLPKERTVSDLDLDTLARNAFAAVDSALGAQNASKMFNLAPAAYSQLAYAREQIADRYADNEVTWLLDDQTFIGDASDLCQGRDQMAQQMRAALGSAYAVNAIVQTKVAFNQPLPDMGNRLQLFGQMQRPSSSTLPDEKNGGGFGLGTARVDIPSGSGGQSATTSFLYGVSDQKIEDERFEEFPLEWAVSHLQVFLEDREIDYCKHAEIAPPSIWLQFIDTFDTAPQMGDTIIPLAFREYPTPPTMVVQTATRDTQSTGTTLADQTRWVYASTYQARLLSRDEIMLNLIYNTGGTGDPGALAGGGAEGPQVYSLFESLVRFQAGYEVLKPQMSPITDATPVDVLTAFSQLVSDIANNSDWAPKSAAGGAPTGPVFTLESDVVTDIATGTGDAREITLIPDPMVTGPNPWVGNKCLTALNPEDMKPYETEQETCSAPGERIVRHSYTPVPPLTGNFVTHQVKVTGLTTLLYENANSGIGTRRNASLYPKAGVFSNKAFIYRTPLVAMVNPITPYVENPAIVQIYPTVVSEPALDIGDYISMTLQELMGVAETTPEIAAQLAEVQAPLTKRRLKIDVRYGFPIGAPSGSNDDAQNFVPQVPVVLVRSFELPVEGLNAAIKDWVGLSLGGNAGDPKPFAAVIYDWLVNNAQLVFDDPTSANAPPKGAFLQFDVTLFSQLDDGGSQNQMPLLRLSGLRLQLSATKPAQPVPLEPPQ